MGKFLNQFKKKSTNFEEKINNYSEKQNFDKNKFNPNNNNKNIDLSSEDEFFNERDMEKNFYCNYDQFYNSGFDEVGVQPAQKPESFHHFILENQYKDLERSIRGLKDVWDKDTQQWRTKRKDVHCFTDEEAEDILRTAQSHLATDIKLGIINKEVFGEYMNAIYKELAFLFESIAEYRYGRYDQFDKNGNLIKIDYQKQYAMKLQNQKIFLELFTRIQANYSRAIGGSENKATHGSVRGQESLQSGDRDLTGYGRRGYS